MIIEYCITWCETAANSDAREFIQSRLNNVLNLLSSEQSQEITNVSSFPNDCLVDSYFANCNSRIKDMVTLLSFRSIAFSLKVSFSDIL